MVPVWMIFSDFFQGHDYWTSNNSKTAQHRAILGYLQCPTNRKSCTIYRTAPFSVTLNDPYPRFQGHAISDAECLRNGTIYTTYFWWNTNRDLHTPYSAVSLRMSLSHLAKYSMTRSVARSLCDSWASCMLRPTFYPCTYDGFSKVSSILYDTIRYDRLVCI